MQRLHAFATAGVAPEAIQLQHTFFRLAGFQQGDTQVVLHKTGEGFLPFQVTQQGNGFLETPQLHVDPRTQKLLFCAYPLRHPAFDQLQRVQCIGKLLFLVVDTGQTVGRFILDRLGDIALEDRLDCTPGFLVHAVGKLEVTNGKFCLAEMDTERVQLRIVQQSILLQLCIETDDRIEVLLLIRMKQCFAKEQVFQLFGVQRSRINGFFGVHSGGRAKQHGKTAQRSAGNCAGQAGEHAYQSLKLMADWVPAIWISTNFGPTAFSTLNVAVPRYSLPDLDLPK